MDARIAAAEPPFPAEVQAWLDRTMPPGKPPLRLFTTLARDPRLFGKFFAAGLLDRGHLTLAPARDRDRAHHGPVPLRIRMGRAHRDLRRACRLHAGADALRWCTAGRRTTAGRRWSRRLLRLCDALHRDCDVDDALWQALRADFSEEAMLELLMLAGFYRTVSILTNALRLPLEPDAARFPPPYIDASSIAR